MKKKSSALIVICIFIMITLCISVLANEVNKNNFSIFINNKKIDSSSTVLKEDSVYIPLRRFCNMLGYGVIFDNSTNSINISEYQYPNYSAIEKNGKYGFEDENGNIIIEPQYMYAEDFSEGLAFVIFDDLSGAYINLKGETVIKNIQKGSRFKNNIAIITEYDENAYETLFDKTIQSDIDYKTYYIDKAGNMLFGRYFFQAGEFQDGLACVQLDGYGVPAPNVKKVYTYIDMSGNYVTDMRFDYASDFKDGYANVILNGVKGVIDTNFNFTAN